MSNKTLDFDLLESDNDSNKSSFFINTSDSLESPETFEAIPKKVLEKDLKFTINDSTNNRKLGSNLCPYKLLIVGGGPSGCSVIIRAARLGFLDELCGFSFLDENGKISSFPQESSKEIYKSLTKVGGVCIVDSGVKERFGGGKLQVSFFTIILFLELITFFLSYMKLLFILSFHRIILLIVTLGLESLFLI